MRIDHGSIAVGGVSFPFGEGTPFHILGFEPGIAGWDVGDSPIPRSDGIRFGRDHKREATYELRLVVQGSSPDHAKELVGSFLQAWDAPLIRDHGGAFAAFAITGSRVAYGRPRGVEVDVSRLSVSRVFLRAQFVAESDRWYGSAVTVEIPLVTESTGGLPVPAAVPFVLGGGTGQADRIVQVGGDTATWPVFTLHGPIKDPFIDVPGVGRLKFAVSLAHDQALTVDTRPWARWVKRDGFAVPGALLPSGARLSDMSMWPGAYQIIFGGYDPTSTARLSVRVEPASPSF